MKFKPLTLLVPAVALGVGFIAIRGVRARKTETQKTSLAQMTPPAAPKVVPSPTAREEEVSDKFQPDKGRTFDDPVYGGIKIFRTPAVATLLSGGWVPFGPDGLEYSVLPLLDGRNGLFARLTYAEALKAATRHGARLPSKAEAKVIWDKGHRVEARGLVRDKNVEDQDQMASLKFAKRYDADIKEQLKVRKWDASKPTANVGKWWVRGAPPGRSWLYGWWNEETGVPVQAGPPQGMPSYQGPHTDKHLDYGTLTYLVRDSSASPVIDAPV